VKRLDPGEGLGFQTVFNLDELPWNDPFNLKMDFGLLRLAEGELFEMEEGLERAFLLMSGAAQLEWSDPIDGKNFQESVHRRSLFEEDPSCLHVSRQGPVRVRALDGQLEMAIMQTPNDQDFKPVLYPPDQCRAEQRGKGTLGETSTRIVRTIFDKSNAPESELVLGEVINFPGRWSSYPPHRHPQPEIYHYRFLPENGFGFSMLGEDAVQVRHRESVLIFDEVHSQTSAPGYAMYYIWAIRHLENNPYGPEFGTPIFDKQHLWVTEPDQQGRIFNGKG